MALWRLSGCAAEAARPTPTPTKTQMPTFTPAPPTATPTEVPPTATRKRPLPSPTEAPTLAPTATPDPPTPEPTRRRRRPRGGRAAAQTRAQARAAPAPGSASAAADPCANIGGDGCKWRVTGGPSFGENGGQELKLQFVFHPQRHDGGQPQGSYFVVLEKDGQRLPIGDNVRSVTGSAQPGFARQVQLRVHLGVDKLPGNTVAGNYTLWVLDGNGERDSRNITFSVPGNSGLIWVRFDQG